MKCHGMLALLFVFVVSGSAAAESKLTHVDVFTSGKDGYFAFRIPAIETAPDGSLVAFAEARKYNRSDPGVNQNDIDLVYKRSTDGGQTWSKMMVLDDPGERWAACNPVTVLDRITDRVWLFYGRTKPDRGSLNSRPGTDDSQAWARYSKDNGLTWSKPTDITKVSRDVENWGSSFFGPGGAIQDKNGRLIVPVAKTTVMRNSKNELVKAPWHAYVIYSDDHGHKWQRGRLLPDRTWGDENQLVELADGRILMDARQGKGPHRWLATSSDGGQTWSKPQPGQNVTPVACAIERYTLKSAGDDRNRIIWTGPKGPKRNRLVVRTSYDEGRTFVGERRISNGLAAYSDLTILKDKTVGVLWERGESDKYQFITFSRFNLEFLESATPK